MTTLDFRRALPQRTHALIGYLSRKQHQVYVIHPYLSDTPRSRGSLVVNKQGRITFMGLPMCPPVTAIPKALLLHCSRAS